MRGADAPPPAVSPADDTSTQALLRARYGSHMDVVKLGLDAWKALGMLYAEWREPWVSSTTAYKQTRALQLLRCAVDVSVTLKALSINKHRSWYTYLTVWVVVPRQIAKHGDLWAFGTSPVEQRGARLKKFVRQVVSWRPYHMMGGSLHRGRKMWTEANRLRFSLLAGSTKAAQ